ncbi:MAG: redoxin domain-containing protein, partial [Granulosicoccaceae bacterium]
MLLWWRCETIFITLATALGLTAAGLHWRLNNNAKHTHKTTAGEKLPVFSAVSVDSGAHTKLGHESGKWQLIVVYRGKHCGRCKKYLNALEAMQSQWLEAGFDITVVSADSRAKAQLDQQEFGWSFPLYCELSEDDMRALGVYISDPLSPDEADGRFAEPAVFCLRSDGTVQIAAISNGPAARPDLAELLDGMVFPIENNRPA